MATDAEGHLTVTVREMSRCAAALLDEVARSGQRIVISRYGRAAALLVPIEEDETVSGLRRLFAAPRYQTWGEGDEKAAQESRMDIGALDDDQIGCLLAISDSAPEWWSPSSLEERCRVARELAELEWAGLVEGSGGLHRLTERGQEVLAQLRGAGR